MNVDGLQPGHRVGIEVVGGRRYFGEVVSVDDTGSVTLRAIGLGVQEEQRRQFFETLAAARKVALRALAMTGPSYEQLAEIARREWPHMPVSLAVSYAEEYLRTGERP